MRLSTAALGVALAASIAGIGLAGTALADEKLPAEQQTKVEALLKQEGFTRWKKIELDDGMIEVDDAIDASGKQFDLKLDPKSLAIVKREAE
ncbi:PepSY domain-containing protein [Methylobacterium planeticum]|uniref:PepSY domain-containing protein n=1 Tax=Methylobacterium planeticum TaxID=2615211 RepID=A0A6N6MYD0_9HYPH|nr:PepSY domain-containing protein [Methylobacterium planeticum]KAB1076126.1 PepSY domain-containing protein [Methylobacterium planeticum]